ncbi:MAG: ZIP family metal transporter [Caldimicrobium sp.]
MIYLYEIFLKDQSLIVLIFLCGLFTLFLTGLGSTGIFFFPSINPKIFSLSLGFAGGIMIAASIWSLLIPALEISKFFYTLAFIPISIGFTLGLALLRVLDMIIPHLHLGTNSKEQEGLKIHLRKVVLIYLAITLHNIPEGIAIGVSLGSASENMEFIYSGLNLVLGIGIQNIPEGLALAFALRQTGLSSVNSFLLSFLSAIVEPIFAVLSGLTIYISKFLLPYFLSLAAGAMIFVTIEELLPEAQKFGNSDLASLGFGGGFLTMMILDTYFS